MKLKSFLALTLIFGSTLAHADKISTPDNPKWKAECGSCHIAFPPQLLTKTEWKQMMNGLEKHFGANASLDAKDTQEILSFLERYAGSNSKYSAPSMRISDTPWFTREHREVPEKAWANPAVKSRANCTACHINAEKGDWSERGIRMPAGLGGGEYGERREHEEHRERGSRKYRDRDDD